MKIKLDYSNMLGFGGVDLGELKAFAQEKATEILDEIKSGKGKGKMMWTQLPFVSEAEIDEIVRFTQPIRKKADSFVVLGIGGSALGSLAVSHALLRLRHNERPRKQRDNAPRFFVEDNIDPERMIALFEVVDVKNSYFNFITKSGETCETLAQFLIVYDILKRKLGVKEARKRVIITTTEGEGSLYDVAIKEGFKIFGVDKGVGGRFSVLSAVGLVPLAAVGIDIRMLLKGAAAMDEFCMQDDIFRNPALMTAYLKYKSLQSGKNISVMMPYADSLKYMADFYAQLWAESLGKALDKNGKTINAGQTPVKALGVTDQHSQLQLYAEGPFDKVVTFLAVEKFRDAVDIPDDVAITDFAFLKHKSLHEVLYAEQKATEYALTKAERGSFTLTMPCVCEYIVGQLITYFMYEVSFAASLMGVDAFDQPGVERGKKAAYAMMGRVGFEDILDDIKATVLTGHVIEE